MADLGKLRRVLDFAPSAAMKGWRERPYFEALNRRLNRLVSAQVLAARAPRRITRDEAVRVVPPEEWEAAQEARAREAAVEAEMRQLREELDEVRSQRNELQRQLDDLQSRLSGLRTVAEEKRVALKLVGVRRAATAPRKVSLKLVGVRRPGPTPVAREPFAPEEPERIGGPPEEVPPEPLVYGPAPEETADLAAADEAIARVEQEIQRIESELRDLGERERTLSRDRPRAPLRVRGYTLYRRPVETGRGPRDLYFFSKKRPVEGEPSPLPQGYRVTTRARSGLPMLRRAGGGRRRARKGRRAR